MIVIIALFNTSHLSMIVAFIRLPPSLYGDLTLLSCIDICAEPWHIVTGVLLFLNDCLETTVQG